MPDTPPGQGRGSHGFDGGQFITITRAEYNAVLRPDGDLDLAVWTVAAGATYPRGTNYMFTAWCRRDDESVTVASEMDGCSQDRTYETCPGTHTFLKLVPDPPQTDSTTRTATEGQPPC